ncbi:MAG: hemolysin family protein [Chlamydiota bacterium]
MLFRTLLFTLLSLTGTSLLSGFLIALQRLGRIQLEEEWEETSSLFFFERIATFLFNKKKWEGIVFSIGFSKNICLFFYAIFAFLFFSLEKPSVFSWEISASLLLYLVVDILMTFLALLKPKFYFTFFSPLAALFLVVLCPLSTLFFRLQKLVVPSPARDKSFRIRDKIIEIFHESDLSPHLDSNDQKLILSVASFKERIAREVMVPRIDVFSLPADTTIREAAQSFLAEGYSRIPVYRENVDNVIGVLLYKDVLNIYARTEVSEQLNDPIESLTKPVLYTPETKKISHLLQEFRNKQIHLAIVVDEYGGTEGIVTIEDILEELVGEIADEYDALEELLYTPLATGGWIIDARMNIIDLEEELGIAIPSSPEYDTIGGYIFHRAGAIPLKGWRIHLDEYDLEVLSSNERSIEKIRITPHPTSD